MKVYVSNFWSPKKGNSQAEYEDAHYPPHPSTDVSGARLRFAVADGATEGSFSRQWAERLTEAYCRASSTEPQRVYERALNRWQRWLGEYMDSRAQAGRPLLWFEEAKLNQGAFSTLLGVSFRSQPRKASHEGRWSAVAVGDSCLFQLRDERVLRAFPIEDSGDFGIVPDLVTTRSNGQEMIAHSARKVWGPWQSGDTFFLATDALSCWFLSSRERGDEPWKILRDLNTEAQPPFEEWMAGLREEGVVRNDDVTLTRIDIL